MNTTLLSAFPALGVRANFGRHTGAFKSILQAIEQDKAPKKLITLEEAKNAGK